MIEKSYNLPDRFELEQTYPELRDLKVVIDGLNMLLDKEVGARQTENYVLTTDWKILMVTLPITMFFVFIPSICYYLFFIKPQQQYINEINESICKLRTKIREFKNEYHRVAIQKFKEFNDAWDEMNKRSAPPVKVFECPKMYFGKHDPIELQPTLAYAVERVRQ